MTHGLPYDIGDTVWIQTNTHHRPPTWGRGVVVGLDISSSSPIKVRFGHNGKDGRRDRLNWVPLTRLRALSAVDQLADLFKR